MIQPTLPTIKECKNITVYYTCSGKWNIRFTVSMFDLKALLLSEDWVFVLFVNLFYFEYKTKDELLHALWYKKWCRLCFSSEKDKPGQTNKPLSELDPFRNYRCTGLIFINNIPTVYTTPPVHLNTDCGVLIFNLPQRDEAFPPQIVWSATN